MITVSVRHESWPLAGTFTISRGSKTTAETVVVELRDGGFRGWGECVPYARYGESVDSVTNQIRALEGDIKNGLDRLGLQEALSPGAARNALDCAFWDLEAKRTDTPVWRLAGLAGRPAPLVTAYTLSLDTPENMGIAARANAGRPLMKLKLTGDGDMERVAAVRRNAPQSRLIVDANEGWTAEMVEPYSRELSTLGVEMIEQPLPATDDALLRDVPHPIPLCADESAHATDGFDALVGKYEMINIKLDKTGGLTEALKLRAMAEAAGLDIMVGCMLAGSLAMAPATFVAQGAKVVDLDGPLLLAGDREPRLEFDGSIIRPCPRDLWG